MDLAGMKTASPEQLAKDICSAISLDPLAGPMIRAVAAAQRLSLLASMGNEEAAKLIEEVDELAFEAAFDHILSRDEDEAAAIDAEGELWKMVYGDAELDDVHCEDYPNCPCGEEDRQADQSDPGDETDHDPLGLLDGEEDDEGAIPLSEVNEALIEATAKLGEDIGRITSREGSSLGDFDIRLEVRNGILDGYGIVGVGVSFRHPGQ